MVDPVTVSIAGASLAYTVATKSGPTVIEPVKNIYHYKDNLKALQEADTQLNAKRADGETLSDEIDARGRDVSKTFELWQSDAGDLHDKAQKITSKSNISRLNLWSLHSSSKKALKLTEDINKKIERAPDFGTSFSRPIAEGSRFNLSGFVKFKSRKAIQKEVLNALRNDDVNMCSICGTRGIGKTITAKKLVQLVEAKDLFKKVAMVTVSRNPDFKNIQNEIIDLLGLKFKESTAPGKAKQLKHWLSRNKTLLILDDVWLHLSDQEFEDIGIPLGNNLCKILVTSTNLDECIKMGSNPNIVLNYLDHGEAWDLFEKNAAIRVEDVGLQATAKKIAAECNGLPIAIVTMARALKDKPQGAWDDSLKKLKMSNLPGIPEMEKVYSKIKVSYDLLNDPEAQSCLRLCCLFPEDYNVPIDKLVFYGWGLELFKGVDSLKEARDRVDSIIHKLKNRFLLLDGVVDGCVKLHDLVRDFAIWDSSKQENPYIVICEKEMDKWPENRPYDKCSVISLVCENIKDHPASLRCPNLKLLILHSQRGSVILSKGFFDGMEELRVLDIQIKSPLPRLTLQKKLRTLLIDGQHDFIGRASPNYFRPLLGQCADMKNLEIFSLSCMCLSEFPAEIRLMCNLRCLRFYRAPFRYMPPGILPNLVKLEELELPQGFNDWGLKDKLRRRVNARFNEIESLQLTSLTIGLRRRSILAETILKGIPKFRIFIESTKFYPVDFRSNFLALRTDEASNILLKRTSYLMSHCHGLELDQVHLKYIMSQQNKGEKWYQCSQFSQLRTLVIKNMGDLEKILLGPYLSNNQSPCFTNLTDIVVQSCPKLIRAFPVSVAREFTQLEYMDLIDCSQMVEVFYEDPVDDANQVESSVNLNTETTDTPTLQNPNGVHGPTRTSFFGSLLRKRKQPKHLPSNQAESSIKLNASATETQTLQNPNDGKSKGKQPKCIPTRQVLQKSNGSFRERKVDRVILLSQLSQLSLVSMPKLKMLYNGLHAIECLSLQELDIFECNDMAGISHGSFKAPRLEKLELFRVGPLKNILKWLGKNNRFPKLSYLSITQCHGMIYLVDAIENPTVHKTFFSVLKKLVVKDMDGLKEIWHGPYLSNMHAPCFSNLTEISISHCPKLKLLFPLSAAAKMGHLKVMEIASCDDIEEIFYKDHVDDENQVVSRIQNASAIETAPTSTSFWRLLPKKRSKHIRTHQAEPSVKLIDPLTETPALQNPNVHKSKGKWPKQIPTHQTTEDKTVQLDEIQAHDAIKLQSVDPVIFSRLKVLKLTGLPKLRIFYDGNHAIELPVINELKIFKCNQMKALSKGPIKAPKLEYVEINRMKHRNGEDLNSIIAEKNNHENDKGLEQPFQRRPGKEHVSEASECESNDSKEISISAEALQVALSTRKSVTIQEPAASQDFPNPEARNSTTKDKTAQLDEKEAHDAIKLQTMDSVMGRISIKAPKLEHVEINRTKHPYGEDLNSIVAEKNNHENNKGLEQPFQRRPGKEHVSEASECESSDSEAITINAEALRVALPTRKSITIQEPDASQC